MKRPAALLCALLSIVLLCATSIAWAAPAYPAMSKDFLTALETLGVRPGMTLRQAQAAAAAWGATLQTAPHSNAQRVAGPDLPYNREAIGQMFRYSVHAEKDYRGHPRTLNLENLEGNAGAGWTTVDVYPVDPRGDLYDPDNLVVYIVDTSVAFVRPSEGQRPSGVMSEAAFLAEGEKRLGHKLTLIDSNDRAACGFAFTDYIHRLVGFAGARQPRPMPHLEAWKQCGPISLATYKKTADDGLNSYRIVHADAALAERAWTSFRVFGSQAP